MPSTFESTRRDISLPSATDSIAVSTCARSTSVFWSPRSVRHPCRSARFAWLTFIANQETPCAGRTQRSEEHTSELQSLMRISYAVFCLKKKTNTTHQVIHTE